MEMQCYQADQHPPTRSCGIQAKAHTKCVFLVPYLGGHFFHRNSLSPRSLVYESEFSTIEPSLDMYDENKT